MYPRAHEQTMQPMIPFTVPHKAAVDVRLELAALYEERALALASPLRNQPAYLADLDEEIDNTRAAYVGLAVTELATLRGEFGGRDQG